MELTWLEVFREVAKRGSFTAAGQALGYTQSAVSRQILALEADLHVTLFDRLARGVRLTEQGRIMLEHADAALARLHLARRDLAALDDLTGGRLRIGAFATADAALIPRAIAAFAADHPGISVSHTEGLTRNLVVQVRDGEIDLAVVSAYPDLMPALASLELRHVLDDPILVALPRAHPLAGQHMLRLVDLADESWIAASTAPEETLISACLRTGFRPRIDIVAREWTAKLGFVAAGLGVTLVPSLAISAIRADIVLAALHPDDTPVRGVYTATMPGVAEPPAVSGFRPFLARAAAALRSELSERGLVGVRSPA